MSVGAAADIRPAGAQRGFGGVSDQTAGLLGSICGTGAGGAGGGGGNSRAAARLILEQVPMVRDSILKGRDWPALAAYLRKHWLGAAARQLARDRAERMLKSFEFLCSMEESAAGGAHHRADDSAGAGNDSGALSAAADSVVRVECWRRVRAGVHERWCEFDCQLDGSRTPEPVEVKGEGGHAAVKGLRHRVIPPASSRALPCDGKVGVGHGVFLGGPGM